MRMPPTVEIFCPKCRDNFIARCTPEGDWTVRTRTKDGDRWRPTAEWATKELVCPDCHTSGWVDVFALAHARGITDRRRIRIPLKTTASVHY
jgi:hypothetical protein